MLNVNWVYLPCHFKSARSWRILWEPVNSPRTDPDSHGLALHRNQGKAGFVQKAKPALALKIRRGDAWRHHHTSCHHISKEVQQLPLRSSYSYLLVLSFRGVSLIPWGKRNCQRQRAWGTPT